MGIVYGPNWPFYSCCDYIGLLGTGFMHVLYLSRAPRTKETLPDFFKWRRVTRQPLVFRRLTGSQRTLGFGASQEEKKKKNKGRRRRRGKKKPSLRYGYMFWVVWNYLGCKDFLFGI